MNNTISTDTLENVISISELNRTSRQLLEQSIGLIWVTGEISNLAQPMSGHCYFSLKDNQSQARCACFRGVKNSINFNLENGQQVVVLAKVSLYEPRGDYQLIIQKVLLSGDGLLQFKFNELKKLCEKKGWFDAKHKKPRPHKVHTLGIITSSTGAAIQDIIKVLQRRSPLVSLIIYPTLVQGAHAAPEIVKAIQIANQRDECDLLLLGRGGGSLEDLWCFNEESVAHEIFHSNIPIITGIGHEIDTTIADWVADIRAATPSAAAELASPDQQEQHANLALYHQQINSLINRYLDTNILKLQQCEKRLRHPGDKLREHTQTLDQFEIRLKHNINHLLEIQASKLAGLSHTLNTLSPLNTLARGFTITRKKGDQIITSVNGIQINDAIEVQFKDGTASAIVQQKSH
jgi:exodeoxyribonuclease VII large subunit